MMSLDEYETLRLLDYEGLNQEECALRMGVARTTVAAMYESARKKLVSAVVEGKRLRIAGGNIEIDRERSEFSVNMKSKGGKAMRVAVEALIAGTLEAIGEANCDHHDHEHGEGHSCGHGRCHE